MAPTTAVTGARGFAAPAAGALPAAAPEGLATVVGPAVAALVELAKAAFAGSPPGIAGSRRAGSNRCRATPGRSLSNVGRRGSASGRLALTGAFAAAGLTGPTLGLVGAAVRLGSTPGVAAVRLGSTSGLLVIGLGWTPDVAAVRLGSIPGVAAVRLVGAAVGLGSTSGLATPGRIGSAVARTGSSPGLAARGRAGWTSGRAACGLGAAAALTGAAPGLAAPG
jgi:hypothetical protein